MVEDSHLLESVEGSQSTVTVSHDVGEEVDTTHGGEGCPKCDIEDLYVLGRVRRMEYQIKYNKNEIIMTTMSYIPKH